MRKIEYQEKLRKPSTQRIIYFFLVFLNLLGLQFPQTGNSTADCDGTSSGECVSTTGNSLAAALAAPNSCASTLDGVLTAESTTVCGVLTNLDLTEKLTQSGTVTGSVLSCDANLLSALSHFY
uniref:Uncharacterized protein n=1 Tax=Ditylum brightwellii TaxID=49249 RepID=A0A6U3UUD2_9STRA